MKKWHIVLPIAAAAFVTMAGLGLPMTAFAHARLKSSTPAVGEVVQTSPPEVVIFFTQEVQKVSGTYDITVEKDRGPSVTAGPAMLDDTDRTKMSVPLQPNLPPGRYVVNYKNVSDADGDPFHGAFSFYVQTQPTTVDKANDAQLAQIGAEEESTPGADTTASADTTPPSGATPSGGASTVPTTGSATAIVTATSPSTTDSGGSNTGRNIAIAGAIVVALAVVAGAAWYAFGRARR